MLAKEREHLLAVADVEVVMREIAGALLQALQVPERVALRPEELGPHVVVGAMDLATDPVVVDHGLRADETAAARNDHSPQGFLQKISVVIS